MKHRPEPKVAREPFPVPAGQLIYDSLKTSFVDFPRVISTLEKEGYTGYIRLLTDDSSGLIFFREGAALECVYDDGHTVARGKDALAALNDDVTRGSGVLDVVALSSELVAGLFDLTISEAVYTELYAGWVDIKGLISFLKDRNQTCVITARAQGVTGVVILTDGDLVGCYTSESRDISLELDPVLNLCQDPQTMIEVKSTVEGVHPKLNVAEIMGSKRPTITAAPTPAAPPPALASPPAPPTPLPSMAPSFATPPPSEQIRTPFPEPAAAPGFSPVPAFNPPSYGSGSPLGQTQPIPFVSATPTPAPTGPAPALPTAWNPGIPGGSGFPTPQAPSRSADSHGGTDWERVIDNLQMLAEESLGNRSRKVKDILAAAERSPAGVADAINQIPSISLLFVDSSRLEALAGEMRGRVQGLV
ncbi:MAG TPA: hypothetical protein VG015_00810 [Candidatus Dormibacteraeota bacterium]|nr:hypothetical protein [Candidatus Dormibacteraeota bacterium]